MSAVAQVIAENKYVADKLQIQSLFVSNANGLTVERVRIRERS